MFSAWLLMRHSVLELKCLLAPGAVLIVPFLIIKLGLELSVNVSETLILISFPSSPLPPNFFFSLHRKK